MNFIEEIFIQAPLAWIGFVLIIGLLGGYTVHLFMYRKRLGDAQKNAETILSDAKEKAELIKNSAKIEVKDTILKSRDRIEKETIDRRRELSHLEKRLLAKEEVLEKKYNQIEKREEDYRRKEDNIKKEEDQIRQTQNELSRIIKQRKDELLQVSKLTEEEAKNYILKILDEELENDKAKHIRKIEAEMKIQAEKKARNIIVLAIQRQALDQSQEHSTKLVPIPNDELKGRIIGREGRNIKAFETTCGVDLIVDDTPDSILISCFDPVRRYIAQVALEKLIAEGRFHPTRIEEIIAKIRKDTGVAIREAGENALYELGITSVHPEIIKLIGQLQFRYSYGQQQLKHSMEVAQLAGVMAAELGVDVKMAKKAGLLHDIGKALTHEIEGSHAMIGADLCKKYGEGPDIEHAIRSHHYDVEPRTVLAFLTEAADAISGGRPGARSKTEGTYIQRLEKLEEICNSFKGVEKAYALQAGRDVRVLVNSKDINDDKITLMAKEISKKIEDEMQFPGQIRVSVIRETRAIEFAH